MILFGLLDSHTQFSDFSNMRIDNYVYTEGSFKEARRLLKPGGVMIVKFEVRDPWTWVGQRFYTMLQRVFGRSPIVFYAPGLRALFPATIFIISDDPGLWARAAQPDLAGLVAGNPAPFSLATASAVVPATDDWPYVYHRDRTYPAHVPGGVPDFAGHDAVFLMRGQMDLRRVSTVQFFLLGAGFLLLETQLVSRLGLYFGTTWLVNCVALTAILCVLVVANAYVKLVRPNRLSIYYALLVVSLLTNYVMPWDRLPYSARFVGFGLERGVRNLPFLRGCSLHRDVSEGCAQVRRLRREHRGSGGRWALPKHFVSHGDEITPPACRDILRLGGLVPSAGPASAQQRGHCTHPL